MRTRLALTLLVLCGLNHTALAQDAKQLLAAYKPRQPGVTPETPTGDALKQCEREVVKEGNGGSSWVVYGPAGQVLRRFTDTDGDNKVDQFSYYNLGVEIYRDIDSDGDESIDQFRWVNTGGTRWGIDTDKDGKIDEWKYLSAPEAAEVAVTAMIAGDARLFQTVVVNATDMRTLGLTGEAAGRIETALEDVTAQMNAAIKQSKALKRGSTWMRFDSQTPGLVPAGRVASKDLMVLQGAMAMVDVAGKSELVQIGELVQVGNTWKLLTVPQGADGEGVASISLLMPPEMNSSGAGEMNVAAATSPEVRKLITGLQKVDSNPPGPTAGARAVAKYNQDRAEILVQLATKAETQAKRDEWTRQLADGVASAIRPPNGWPAGVKLLRDLEKRLAADPVRSKTQVMAYVAYRRLLADYGSRLLTTDPEASQEAQEWWLEQLPLFVRKYPQAPDAADALLEIARNQEFSGKIDEAEQTYKTVASRHPKTMSGKVAAGALTRIQLEGKRLPLRGTDINGRSLGIDSYRGKVTLVAFWSTWCIPCKEELPRLIRMHARHRPAGFEVLGVNLDNEKKPVSDYIQANRIRWNHIHDSGGMQGDIATQFGIISLPTMFLVGRDGKVMARSVSLEELEKNLPDILKGKTARTDRPPRRTGTRRK